MTRLHDAIPTHHKAALSMLLESSNQTTEQNPDAGAGFDRLMAQIGIAGKEAEGVPEPFSAEKIVAPEGSEELSEGDFDLLKTEVVVTEEVTDEVDSDPRRDFFLNFDRFAPVAMNGSGDKQAMRREVESDGVTEPSEQSVPTMAALATMAELVPPMATFSPSGMSSEKAPEVGVAGVILPRTEPVATAQTTLNLTSDDVVVPAVAQASLGGLNQEITAEEAMTSAPIQALNLVETESPEQSVTTLEVAGSKANGPSSQDSRTVPTPIVPMTSANLKLQQLAMGESSVKADPLTEPKAALSLGTIGNPSVQYDAVQRHPLPIEFEKTAIRAAALSVPSQAKVKTGGEAGRMEAPLRIEQTAATATIVARGIEAPAIAPGTAWSPPTPSIQSVEPTSKSAEPADLLQPQILEIETPEWEMRLVERIAANLKENGASIELSLMPENLGQLDVQLELHDGTAEVSFVTETREAARLISQAESKLSELLSRQGFSFGGQQSAPRDERAAQHQSAIIPNRSDEPDSARAGAGAVRNPSLVNLVA